MSKHEGNGYDFELYQDLFRSAQTLDGEGAERVETARDGLLTVLGMMSAHVPENPTPDDIVGLTRLAASAVRFRNVIRAEFIKHDPDLKLPEGYDYEQGHYIDEETVH